MGNRSLRALVVAAGLTAGLTTCTRSSGITNTTPSVVFTPEQKDLVVDYENIPENSWKKAVEVFYWLLFWDAKIELYSIKNKENTTYRLVAETSLPHDVVFSHSGKFIESLKLRYVINETELDSLANDIETATTAGDLRVDLRYRVGQPSGLATITDGNDNKLQRVVPDSMALAALHYVSMYRSGEQGKKFFNKDLIKNEAGRISFKRPKKVDSCSENREMVY